MNYYLSLDQIKSNLKIGKAIEQWLAFSYEEEYTVLKWLRVEKDKDDCYLVTYFESFDEGNKDFLDIYEFSLLDPDEPFGIISTFDSIEEALKFSNDNYGALDNSFVSAGMIQEEYRKHLNK